MEVDSQVLPASVVFIFGKYWLRCLVCFDFLFCCYFVIFLFYLFSFLDKRNSLEWVGRWRRSGRIWGRDKNMIKNIVWKRINKLNIMNKSITFPDLCVPTPESKWRFPISSLHQHCWVECHSLFFTPYIQSVNRPVCLCGCYSVCYSRLLWLMQSFPNWPSGSYFSLGQLICSSVKQEGLQKKVQLSPTPTVQSLHVALQQTWKLQQGMGLSMTPLPWPFQSISGACGPYFLWHKLDFLESLKFSCHY